MRGTRRVSKWAYAMLLSIALSLMGSNIIQASESTVDEQEFVVYHQNEVSSMGEWEVQGDTTYKFKLNTGDYLKSSWVESLSEKNAYYYVNEYGVRVVNGEANGYIIGKDGIYRNKRVDKIEGSADEFMYWFFVWLGVVNASIVCGAMILRER